MYEITKKRKRGTCKICRGKFWWISQNKYCKNCLVDRINLSRLQIKHKEGPIYEKWKRNMMRGLED